MDKLLKVCRSAQGNKYTSSINIKGDWLKKYGFQLDDFVKVEIHKNKIIIEKNQQTEAIKEMGIKNAALLSLIEKLDLTV